VTEFGKKFRLAREAKDISLDDVSNVTKISARMLQAIEEDHFDQLPGGVFNKGFIRAYAKHLGLNAEEAINDYLLALRQAQVDAHEVWDPAHPVAPRTPAPRPAAPEKSSAPAYSKPTLKEDARLRVQEEVGEAEEEQEELPHLQLPRAEDIRPTPRNFAGAGDNSFPWRILALAAVIVVLGAVLWIRHSRATHTQAASAKPQPAATASVPTLVNASQPASSAPAVNAAINQPSSALDAKPSPTTESPAHASTTAAAHAAQKSGDDSGEKVIVKNDVTIRTFNPAPAPPAKAAAPMTLIIRANETTWVSVIADGQPHTQETLIAPAHTSVRASREITVKVGNAAGVSFLWNNQEIEPQGAEAEVKTFTFDSTGIHPATQPQNQ
jgi:cytoskeletal protein RodZ